MMGDAPIWDGLAGDAQMGNALAEEQVLAHRLAGIYGQQARVTKGEEIKVNQEVIKVNQEVIKVNQKVIKVNQEVIKVKHEVIKIKHEVLNEENSETESNIDYTDVHGDRAEEMIKYEAPKDEGIVRVKIEHVKGSKTDIEDDIVREIKEELGADQGQSGSMKIIGCVSLAGNSADPAPSNNSVQKDKVKDIQKQMTTSDKLKKFISERKVFVDKQKAHVENLTAAMIAHVTPTLPHMTMTTAPTSTLPQMTMSSPPTSTLPHVTMTTAPTSTLPHVTMTTAPTSTLPHVTMTSPPAASITHQDTITVSKPESEPMSSESPVSEPESLPMLSEVVEPENPLPGLPYKMRSLSTLKKLTEEWDLNGHICPSPICEQYLRTNVQMFNHWYTSHMARGYCKLFFCRVCRHEFRDRYKYQKHLRNRHETNAKLAEVIGAYIEGQWEKLVSDETMAQTIDPPSIDTIPKKFRHSLQIQAAKPQELFYINESEPETEMHSSSGKRPSTDKNNNPANHPLKKFAPREDAFASLVEQWTVFNKQCPHPACLMKLISLPSVPVLVGHWTEQHNRDSSRYACNMCPVRVEDEATLQQHMLFAHRMEDMKESVIQMIVSQKRNTNKSAVETQSKTHHEAKASIELTSSGSYRSNAQIPHDDRPSHDDRISTLNTQIEGEILDLEKIPLDRQEVANLPWKGMNAVKSKALEEAWENSNKTCPHPFCDAHLSSRKLVFAHWHQTHLLPGCGIPYLCYGRKVDSDRPCDKVFDNKWDLIAHCRGYHQYADDTIQLLFSKIRAMRETQREQEHLPPGPRIPKLKLKSVRKLTSNRGPRVIERRGSEKPVLTPRSPPRSTGKTLKPGITTLFPPSPDLSQIKTEPLDSLPTTSLPNHLQIPGQSFPTQTASKSVPPEMLLSDSVRDEKNELPMALWKVILTAWQRDLTCPHPACVRGPKHDSHVKLLSHWLHAHINRESGKLYPCLHSTDKSSAKAKNICYYVFADSMELARHLVSKHDYNEKDITYILTAIEDEWEANNKQQEKNRKRSTAEDDVNQANKPPAKIIKIEPEYPDDSFTEDTSMQNGETDMEIRHKCKKNPLTKEEKDLVDKAMAYFLQILKVPGKVECESCVKALRLDRDWKSVKYYMYNKIVMLRRTGQIYSEMS